MEISLHKGHHQNTSWHLEKSGLGVCHYYQPSKLKTHHLIPRDKPVRLLILGLEECFIQTNQLGFWIQNPSDWKFKFPLDNFLKLCHRGYHPIIATNQQKLDKLKHLTWEQLLVLLENVIRKIDHKYDIDVATYISCREDYFQKPSTGMIDFHLKKGGWTLHPQSIVVGRNAGRNISKRKHDTASYDYYLAQNLGCRFQSPETFFLGNKTLYQIAFPVSFHPRYYFTDDYGQMIPEWIQTLGEGQKMVIMVGSPASGKSRVAKSYFGDFVRINQDGLKTLAKCIGLADVELRNGNNIIIDNCNREISLRQKWIQMGQKYGAKIGVIHINIPINMSLHLNTYRSLEKNVTGKGDKIPEIAIYTYYKRFEPPTSKEGIHYILTIGLDNHFSSDLVRKRLTGYLRHKYDASNMLEGG